MRTTRWSRTLLEDNGSAHGEGARGRRGTRGGVRDATRAGGRACERDAGTARTPGRWRASSRARDQCHVAGSEKTIRPDLLILPGTPESARFPVCAVADRKVPTTTEDDGHVHTGEDRAPSRDSARRGVRGAHVPQAPPPDGRTSSVGRTRRSFARRSRSASAPPRGRRGAHRESELTLAKCAAPSRLQLYLVDGQPVLYDPSGKGDYELTVFALWRVPHLMGEPVAVRHPRSRATSRAARISCSRASAPSPRDPSAPANVSRSPSRETAPFAIGETEMKRGRRGRAGKGILRVVTCYRDALWGVAACIRPAALSPNDGYLEDGVVPVGAEGIDDLDEDEDTDDEGPDEVPMRVPMRCGGRGRRDDVEGDDGTSARRATALSLSEKSPRRRPPRHPPPPRRWTR